MTADNPPSTMSAVVWLRTVVAMSVSGSTHVRAVALLFSGLVLSTTLTSRADSNPKCVTAFEDGQRLRKEGKLHAAGEALIECSQPTCPGFISKECTSLYAEVQASQPSMVFSAKQGDRLLRDVRVYVDGALVSEQSDGRSIPVDPGPHAFKFEVDGKEPIVVSNLAIEGEKNKPLSVDFPVAKPVTPATLAPLPASVPEPSEAPAVSHSPPVAAYILGGVGILAIGSGVVFRAIGKGEFSDMESGCKPTCQQDEVDKAKLKYTISDLSLGVGGAALVAAGVLFLVNGSSGSRATTALTVVPAVSQSSASAFWVGEF